MSALPKAELTHLGILVWDLDKMVAFYEREFGMVVARIAARPPQG